MRPMRMAHLAGLREAGPWYATGMPDFMWRGQVAVVNSYLRVRVSKQSFVGRPTTWDEEGARSNRSRPRKNCALRGQ